MQVIFFGVIKMPNNLHNHLISGATSYNAGHIHNYRSVTSSNPDTPNHVHYVTGVTTFNHGHVHYYRFYTSPPVETGNGHLHYYQSVTTYNNGHVHTLSGATSVYPK